jgi:benzoyl-CoA reductase/2-hydroxyglutaryl-CoA dehydratase subunit BcrC/BadD/HgdB
MATPGKTMKVFEELLESPQNRLVEQAAQDGRIPIGYSCSFVPEALLMADKLFPVRLHVPGLAGTELADNYLSSFVCSYARGLLEFAMDGRFDFLQGSVFVPSCNHMQRLFDNLQYLKKSDFNYILDVPRKVNKDTLVWMAEELKTIADKLAAHFNVDMSDASLRKAMQEWNDFVSVIQSVGELRKKPHPPFTGTEFHQIVMAALASPKDLILPYILDFKKEIEGREGMQNYRARLMVVGGHLYDPEFIKIIESQGGLVVADRFCTGTIPGFKTIELNDDGPYKIMAEYTFANYYGHCKRIQGRWSGARNH